MSSDIAQDLEPGRLLEFERDESATTTSDSNSEDHPAIFENPIREPSPVQYDGIESSRPRRDSLVMVRRSKRNPDMGLLNRRDVKQLLRKIRRNHSDTVVLKLKDHITIEISPAVMDKIIKALKSNRVCQALYIQNFSRAIGDDQITALVEVLKTKFIWCVNIGENYEVSTRSWEYFCNSLPMTNVTHLYVSEHTIKLKLKNLMRTHIRQNRKKHDKHSSLKNIRVIQRCTNMWWNPINSIKHELEIMSIRKEILEEKSKSKSSSGSSTPSSTSSSSSSCNKNQNIIYDNENEIDEEDANNNELENESNTATGSATGTDLKWKFSCVCKEICSYYENPKYHPIGRMFQCTKCLIWSHVECVLGDVSQEYLEELPEVLCHKCRCRVRRQRLRELSSLDMIWEDGQIKTIGSTLDEDNNSNNNDNDDVKKDKKMKNMKKNNNDNDVDNMDNDDLNSSNGLINSIDENDSVDEDDDDDDDDMDDNDNENDNDNDTDSENDSESNIIKKIVQNQNQQDDSKNHQIASIYKNMNINNNEEESEHTETCTSSIDSNNNNNSSSSNNNIISDDCMTLNSTSDDSTTTLSSSSSSSLPIVSLPSSMSMSMPPLAMLAQVAMSLFRITETETELQIETDKDTDTKSLPVQVVLSPLLSESLLSSNVIIETDNDEEIENKMDIISIDSNSSNSNNNNNNDMVTEIVTEKLIASSTSTTTTNSIATIANNSTSTTTIYSGVTNTTSIASDIATATISFSLSVEKEQEIQIEVKGNQTEIEEGIVVLSMAMTTSESEPESQPATLPMDIYDINNNDNKDIDNNIIIKYEECSPLFPSTTSSSPCSISSATATTCNDNMMTSLQCDVTNDLLSLPIMIPMQIIPKYEANTSNTNTEHGVTAISTSNSTNTTMGTSTTTTITNISQYELLDDMEHRNKITIMNGHSSRKDISQQQSQLLLPTDDVPSEDVYNNNIPSEDKTEEKMSLLLSEKKGYNNNSSSSRSSSSSCDSNDDDVEVEVVEEEVNNNIKEDMKMTAIENIIEEDVAVDVDPLLWSQSQSYPSHMDEVAVAVATSMSMSMSMSMSTGTVPSTTSTTTATRPLLYLQALHTLSPIVCMGAHNAHFSGMSTSTGIGSGPGIGTQSCIGGGSSSIVDNTNTSNNNTTCGYMFNGGPFGSNGNSSSSNGNMQHIMEMRQNTNTMSMPTPNMNMMMNSTNSNNINNNNNNNTNSYPTNVHTSLSSTITGNCTGNSGSGSSSGTVGMMNLNIHPEVCLTNNNTNHNNNNNNTTMSSNKHVVIPSKIYSMDTSAKNFDRIFNNNNMNINNNNTINSNNNNSNSSYTSHTAVNNMPMNSNGLMSNPHQFINDSNPYQTMTMNNDTNRIISSLSSSTSTQIPLSSSSSYHLSNQGPRISLNPFQNDKTSSGSSCTSNNVFIKDFKKDEDLLQHQIQHQHQSMNHHLSNPSQIITGANTGGVGVGIYQPTVQHFSHNSQSYISPIALPASSLSSSSSSVSSLNTNTNIGKLTTKKKYMKKNSKVNMNIMSTTNTAAAVPFRIDQICNNNNINNNNNHDIIMMPIIASQGIIAPSTSLPLSSGAVVNIKEENRKRKKNAMESLSSPSLSTSTSITTENYGMCMNNVSTSSLDTTTTATTGSTGTICTSSSSSDNLNMNQDQDIVPETHKKKSKKSPSPKGKSLSLHHPVSSTELYMTTSSSIAVETQIQTQIVETDIPSSTTSATATVIHRNEHQLQHQQEPFSVPYHSTSTSDSSTRLMMSTDESSYHHHNNNIDYSDNVLFNTPLPMTMNVTDTTSTTMESVINSSIDNVPIDVPMTTTTSTIPINHTESKPKGFKFEIVSDMQEIHNLPIENNNISTMSSTLLSTSIPTSTSTSIPTIDKPHKPRPKKRKHLCVNAPVIVVSTNQKGVITDERPGGWKYVTFIYDDDLNGTIPKKPRKKSERGKHFRPSELAEIIDGVPDLSACIAAASSTSTSTSQGNTNTTSKKSSTNRNSVKVKDKTTAAASATTTTTMTTTASDASYFDNNNSSIDFPSEFMLSHTVNGCDDMLLYNHHDDNDIRLQRQMMMTSNLDKEEHNSTFLSNFNEYNHLGLGLGLGLGIVVSEDIDDFNSTFRNLPNSINDDAWPLDSLDIFDGLDESCTLNASILNSDDLRGDV